MIWRNSFSSSFPLHHHKTKSFPLHHHKIKLHTAQQQVPYEAINIHSLPNMPVFKWHVWDEVKSKVHVSPPQQQVADAPPVL